MSEPSDNSAEAWVQAGYRYALSLTHNREDAEDLVQQAWLKLTRRYGRVKNRSMIFTTIRHAFYDQRRRANIVAFDPLEDAPEPVAPPVDVAEGLHQADMDAILAVLRPVEREALYLNVVEGYTAKEIGRLTGTPRNTVLSLIHRAREKLRAAWGDRNSETAGGHG
ncbi:MAG: sigma-70 family RNA polymerase sigma factor [Acidobacteria bacterium]|nr:sigma-70 family RNA polymerase sigma factor [Acidobacteriota bacterium]